MHRVRNTDVLAAMHHLEEFEVERKLNEARQKLFNARERRVKPARDAKILTGWNGLIFAAFAVAARVLKREDYRKVAESNAAFLLENLRDANGRLKRSYKDGQARLNGYLEDFANLAEGLLALYEITFGEQYWRKRRPRSRGGYASWSLSWRRRGKSRLWVLRLRSGPPRTTVDRCWMWCLANIAQIKLSR